MIDRVRPLLLGCLILGLGACAHSEDKPDTDGGVVQPSDTTGGTTGDATGGTTGTTGDATGGTTGTTGDATGGGTAAGGTTDVQRAQANLLSKSGSNVTGTVQFEQTAGGVRVHLQASGLTPGEHGFHVHEKGDCSADDASSAGPHFGGAHQQHGALRQEGAHYGDFGNVTADAQGMVEASFEVPNLTLSQGENAILGRSVILHEKADDLKTQPAGDSGARQACGVIEPVAAGAEPAPMPAEGGGHMH